MQNIRICRELTFTNHTAGLILWPLYLKYSKYDPFLVQTWPSHSTSKLFFLNLFCPGMLNAIFQIPSIYKHIFSFLADPLEVGSVLYLVPSDHLSE